MQNKYKIIYDEEVENPGFYGFHHIIISNNDEFIFGYYDIVDEDMAIWRTLEEFLDSRIIPVRFKKNIPLLLNLLAETKGLEWEERMAVLKNKLEVVESPTN